MTISNSNILPGMFSPGDTPLEGMMSSSMQQQSTQSASDNDQTGDSEFWMMVRQQLGTDVNQDDVQGLADKDMQALINQFEANLGEGAINSEWLQVLKSHFGGMPDGEEAVGAVEMSAEMIAQSEPEAILNQSGDLLTSDQLDNLAEEDLVDGVALPLMWQDQAASQQVQVTQKQAAINPEVRNAVASISPVLTGEKLQNIDANKNSLQGHQASVDDLTVEFSEPGINAKEGKSDSIKDKASVNLLSGDQISGNLKSPDILGASQNNTAMSLQSFNPAQPQNSQGLPSALQTLTLQPLAPATAWGDAIGERVAFLINNKLNSAEIRIDPPHLGKLDIQIQIKDDSAVVMIQAHNVQTRDLLDSASNRLRDFLQDAGFSSVDVNVSHQEHSAQQDGSSQQDDFSDPATGNVDDSEQNSPGMRTAEIDMTGQDGTIDYFA